MEDCSRIHVDWSSSPSGLLAHTGVTPGCVPSDQSGSGLVHLNDAHSVVVFGGLPEYSHAATMSRLDGPAATASQMGNGENPRPSGRSGGRGRGRGPFSGQSPGMPVALKTNRAAGSPQDSHGPRESRGPARRSAQAPHRPSGRPPAPRGAGKMHGTRQRRANRLGRGVNTIVPT
jgi:hypothetical protein